MDDDFQGYIRIVSRPRNKVTVIAEFLNGMMNEVLVPICMEADLDIYLVEILQLPQLTNDN
jgi:hypothetical protein